MSLHKYRVKPGYSYGPRDEYTSGMIIVLDDSVAKHEMDKLELAEVVIPGSADVTEKEEGKKVEKQSTPPEKLFTEAEPPVPAKDEASAEEIKPTKRK